MDVVASEVRQLGGSLDIASKPGEGTTFTLRLPQTLAVTQAVFVQDRRHPVRGAHRLGARRRPHQPRRFNKPDAVYRYGGEDYALHDLGSLVGSTTVKAEGQLQMPLLLVRSGDLRAAVAIDQVVGNREIVVKPGGPQLASVPGIFGATIMGDGRVVVILDIAPLVRRFWPRCRATWRRSSRWSRQRRVPLVMVVDDSITMRKVTGRVLERHNFEVATAKDGIDALERMADASRT
jgi:chemosensory pili system protein ChpA (sensor histidine kinase/response regulator)